MKYPISILFLLCNFCFAQQSFYFQTKDEKPDYNLITGVEVGEPIYSDSSESGVRYRIIITTFEIYQNIFIEQQSLGAEAIPDSTNWSKLIKLYDIVTFYKISSEQQHVSDLQFISPKSFVFSMGGKKFRVNEIDKEQVNFTLISN